MLNSVRVKTSAAVVALIFFIMALVTYIFIISEVDRQREEVRRNMARIAMQIASIRLAETEGWYVYQDWIDNIIESEIGEDLVYIAIYNEEDSLTAYTINYDLIDLGGTRYLTREESERVVLNLTQGRVAEESIEDFDHQVVDIRWGSESLGFVDVGFSLIEFNNRVRERLVLDLVLLLVFCAIGVGGSILISQRLTRPLDRLSQSMMAVTAGDFSQGVENRRGDEIGRLARTFNYMLFRLREKQVIERFSAELSYTFEWNRLLAMITERIVEAMGAVSGRLYLVEDGNNRSVVCRYPIEHAGDEIELDPEWALKALDPPASSAGGGTVVVPLKGGGHPVGFLLLEKGEGQKDLDEDERRFLSTLSGQAAMAIEKAHLLRELREQERLKEELEIARRVQRQLLPAEPPDLPGVDIFGICLPAAEVGGDYYDYYPVSKTRIGVSIVDVAGKGTSAAFYMAEIKGMMTSLVESFDSPGQLLNRINEGLYKGTRDRRIFATMLFGILDLERMSFTFVRAGHNALLLRRAGGSGSEMLIPSGIGLGLAPTEAFERHLQEYTVDLSRNDLLLLYTDGLDEAMNQNHQQFGEARLGKILFERREKNSEAMIKAILEKIEAFRADAPQHDDITMVLMRLT